MEQSNSSRANRAFCTVRLLPWLVTLLLCASQAVWAARPSVNFTNSPAGITDEQQGYPFVYVEVTDADTNDTVTTQITFSAERGTFPTGNGLTSSAGGTYDLSARSPEQAQLFLRALAFTPTRNRINIGSTEDTTFTVSVTDSSTNNNNSASDTVSLTVTPTNDPPQIVGTVTTSLNDSGPATLFGGITISDVDNNSNQTLTVTATLSTNAIGTFPPENTTFSTNGSPTAATTLIRGLQFQPARNIVPVGSNGVVSVTLTVSDGIDSTSVVTNVSVLSINDPPTVTGSILINPAIISDRLAGQFFSAQITDPDVGEQFTLSIESLNDPGFTLGTFSPSNSFTGSEIFVEGQVRNATYTPVPNQVIGSTNVQFVFVVSDQHTNAQSATKTLTITGVNHPPDIVGVPFNTVYINSDEPLQPFTTVSIEDVDLGGHQPVTVTITMDNTSIGTNSIVTNLWTLGTTPPAPARSLTFANLDPADATTAIRSVLFTPNPDAIPLGQVASVSFTIRVVDSYGQSSSDNGTRVVVTRVNATPRINGVPDLAEQPKRVPPADPRPFTGITITDDDTNLTLTVSLDDADKGTLSNLSGFQSLGGGVYQLSDATPAAATTALTNLTFVVNTNHLFPASAPGGVTFVLKAVDPQLNTRTESLSIVLQTEPRNHLVTNTEDDGSPGSLRQVVATTENDGIITFALPEYPAVIRLQQSNGPIVLDRNVEFAGPGADLLSISGDTDGNGQGDLQLFRVSAAVVMDGLTLTQGNARNGTNLTGGAIYVGPSGQLRLRYCAVTDSRAAQWGGAIDVDQGSLDMEHCLVRGNATDDSLGLGGGGVSLYTDQLCSFVNTTFSSNRQASTSGFGGGAMYAENYDPITDVPILVVHCTFAGNDDSAGLGTSIRANVFGTWVFLQNSIFADGRSRNLEVEGAGQMFSLGGNVSDDSTRTVLTQGGVPESVILLNMPSDRTETDARLMPLDLTVRPTPVYPLRSDSPAIGRAVAPVEETDQRGVLRDSAPDAGAYEFDRTERVVLNEIYAGPPGQTNFLELYVPRNSAPVDFNDYAVRVNGDLVHVFTNHVVVQPGRGLVIADGLITAGDATNPAPVILPSRGSLNLTNRGTVELRTTASLDWDGNRVLAVNYIGEFADPDDPANALSFTNSSLTLAPQFRGFAYVPNRIVLPPLLGGVDLMHNGAPNSPGRDTANAAFGSPNAPPLAVPDVVFVGEDQLLSLPVLGNDLDADGLDRIYVINVSTTSSINSNQATTVSAAGADVSFDPLSLPGTSPTPPLRGTNVTYDPRQALRLQSLPEGARTNDSFYYTIVDIGTGPILDYQASNGVSIVSSPAHRLTNGDVIAISGAGVSNYNGIHTVTRIGEDSFSIPVAFAGNPSAKGSWVTKDQRHPTERSEAQVSLSVLGANDPPAPTADTVATDEETILRIMGDSALKGTTNTVFDTDPLYPQPRRVSDVSLLQNDSDPDSDDNFSTLNLVGVVGQVHVITNYEGVAGEAPVTVRSPAHGLGDETVVLISSYGGDPSYNGFHTISVVDSNTFTIPVTYVDNDTNKGVWAILDDANRLSTTSAQGAAVALEIRADRIETSIVYNPRTAAELNSLSLNELTNDWFYCAVEDSHGAVTLSPVFVNVTGVNDAPQPEADPSSLAGLNVLLTGGETLSQIITQLQVAYYLPPASGTSDRADVRVQYTDGQTTTFLLSDVWTTDEDTALSIGSADLLANDQDLDQQDVLSVKSVDGLSREGAQLALSANHQTITYDPRTSASLNSLAREETLIDTFEITVTDSRGGDVSSLVAVLVVGRNDTPVAHDDLATTPEDTVLMLNPILYPPNDASLHDEDPDINGVAPDNRLSLVPLAQERTAIGAGLSLADDTISYDPSQSDFLNELGQGETFEDRFAYSVMDGSLIFANNDLFKVEADSADLVLDVLANDSNLTGAGGVLTIVSVGTPDHGGTVTIDSSGTAVVYTPTINFVGDEIFKYTVSDASGNTDSGLVTVRVTVNQLNGHLQANPDTFSVARGESPVLNVLANDNVLPASGQSLTITRIVSQPADDQVMLSNNQITYVQLASGPFPYERTFSYEVSGGGTATAIAEVTVQVIDRGDSLSVRDDAFSVLAGSSDNALDVLANDNILPGTGSGLTIREISQAPTNGTVAINSDQTGLVYSPQAGFIGQDAFAYVATDGLGGTGTGMVKIIVGSLTTANDFFVVPYDDPDTTADDGPVELDVLANDQVLQGATGAVAIVNVTPTNATIGTMTITNGQRLLFNAAEGKQGEQEFTYTIGDGAGRTATGKATVAIVTEGVKANADFFAVMVDSSANELDVLRNDAAIPDQGRKLSIAGLGTGPNGPNHGGIVTINGTNDRLIYTPAAGYSGEETFTYTMTDSKGTDTAKVIVRVESGVLAANDDAFTVFFEPPPSNGTPRQFTLPVLANDRVLPDLGQLLTITGVGIDDINATNAPDRQGTVQISADASTLIYVPGDEDGPFPYVERFTYEISDGGTRRADAVVMVEVQKRTNVRDLDTEDDAFSVTGTSSNNVLPVLVNDNVKPATAAGWSITGITTPKYNGVVVVSGTNLLYTPQPGFVGTDELEYSVSDGFGGTGSATVKVTVGDLPVCDDLFTVVSGSTNNALDVLANDAIRPATGSGFMLFDAGGADRNGIITVSDDLVWYTPDPGYAGSYPYIEHFVYRVVDDSSLTVTGRVAVTVYQKGSDRASADVIVTVTGVNDPPTITGTVSGQSVYRGCSIRPFAGVTIADVDSHGTQPQIVTITVDQPDQGFLVVSGGFVDQGGGVYVLGSSNAPVAPATATAAVRGLTFVPTTDDRVAPSTPELTQLTIQVDDLIAPPVSDDSTTVLATHAFMAKLLADDGGRLNQFGLAVGASRDVVVVGAPYAPTGGISAGAAYVYERDPNDFSSWVQVKKLLPTGILGSDQFGCSVAISGDTVVVGARSDSENGVTSGSVYVFERDEGGTNLWGLVRKLLPADGVNGAEFGHAVSVDQETLAVGARSDDDKGSQSGSLYVFGRNQGGTNQWGLSRKVVAGDGAAGDRFGCSVGLSGETIVVGALQDDTVGADSGSAYVFERNQGGIEQWGQVKKLQPSTPAASDQFGNAVAIHEDLIVVGASLANDQGTDSGSAFLFARDQGGSGQWGQIAKLLPADGAALAHFGSAVSVNRGIVLIGASNDAQMGQDAGAAYVFKRDPTDMQSWIQVDKLLPDGTSTGGNFGLAVSLSSGTVVIGARYEVDQASITGSAYIFRLKFNNPPVLAMAVPDQGALVGVPFTYMLPSGLFADADLIDSLQVSVSGLPAWLSFDPWTGTFSGTPTSPGRDSLLVTGTDEEGASATDSFDIVVWDGSGSSSTVTIPGILPFLRITDEGASGQVRISYQRLKSDASLIYSLVASTDLVNWIPADGMIVSQSVASIDSLIEEVSLFVPKSAIAGTGVYFMLGVAGSSGSLSAGGLVPVLEVANGPVNDQVSVSFQRSILYSSLHYTLLWSTNLVDWMPAEAQIKSVSIAGIDPLTERVGFHVQKLLVWDGGVYFKVQVQP